MACWIGSSRACTRGPRPAKEVAVNQRCASICNRCHCMCWHSFLLYASKPTAASRRGRCGSGGGVRAHDVRRTLRRKPHRLLPHRLQGVRVLENPVLDPMPLNPTSLIPNPLSEQLDFVSVSQLTKLGAARKAQLEDGFKEGGQRTATQVWAAVCPGGDSAQLVCVRVRRGMSGYVSNTI